MPAVVFIAHHVRNGINALNVITGALRADPRTAKVEIVFARSRDAVADAARAAASRGDTALVGWSFYSPDFGEVTRDLRWVKERHGDGRVLHVAGGVHATAEPVQTLEAGFDRVALGEGERTATDLVAAVASGADPDRVGGLGRLAAGGYRSTGPGERAPLDDYPAFNVPDRKFGPIEITRGCVFACSFCQTPFMFKARFRHRGVANVREHVAAMRREGLRYVRFLTPTSLSYGSDDERVDLPRVEELLAATREAIGPEGKIYFGTFPSEVRPEHVTPEAMRVIARYADNDNLVIGGQSGSQRVLEASRRDHSVEDVVRSARVALEAGFRPNVDLLFGLPGEEPDDVAATLALARELTAMGARIHTHAFMPLPGTPLRDAPAGAVPPDAEREIARLESTGASYGQWRRQIVAAGELSRRRRGEIPTS